MRSELLGDERFAYVRQQKLNIEHNVGRHGYRYSFILILRSDGYVEHTIHAPPAHDAGV
jgi:hypothetical protein